MWNCGLKECTDPSFKGNAHNDRISNLVPLHPLMSYVLFSWILHAVLWNSWFCYMNFWTQSTDSRLFFLLFYRTIQWFGSERTFKDHLIPPSPMEEDTFNNFSEVWFSLASSSFFYQMLPKKYGLFLVLNYIDFHFG